MNGEQRRGGHDQKACSVGVATLVCVVDCARDRVRRVGTSGIITTVAGDHRLKPNGMTDGSALSTCFGEPQNLASDSAGNLYIADAYLWRIWRANIAGPTFAAVQGFGVRRCGAFVRFRWWLARDDGVLGFNVFAGRHRLSASLIPVHWSRWYRLTERYRRGHPWLQLVLGDGSTVSVKASPLSWRS